MYNRVSCRCKRDVKRVSLIYLEMTGKERVDRSTRKYVNLDVLQYCKYIALCDIMIMEVARINMGKVMCVDLLIYWDGYEDCAYRQIVFDQFWC